MQPFVCSVCGQLLFFENSTCLNCHAPVGFVVEDLQLVAMRFTDAGLERADGLGGVYRPCANQLLARCNWLVPAEDPAMHCRSCRLTSVRPNDSEVDSLAAFADAEAAKRRLLHQLFTLRLPVVDRTTDPVNGVSFELLSSRGRNVVTGHEGGVITLDLSESDDAHREFVRKQLGEQYRTVLGHLRHEIAHYYWPHLVTAANLDAFRGLFGDERVSYEQALAQHYSNTADYDWSTSHVSHYATMHPWEDWAETFAHYLHIDDGLRTAAAFGMAVNDPAKSAGEAAGSHHANVVIGDKIQEWLSLTIGLNAMARSIGQSDLYPFVLSPVVVDKLDFVHRAVQAAAAPPAG